MDQFFSMVLTEKINERTYTLVLPVGAPWAEAVQAAEFFSQAVIQLSQDAEKRLQEATAKQEPVEAAAEPVSEGN